MTILEECEAAMRSGAGPYASPYTGSHPHVTDRDLAEWLRPHGTEEVRAHAIALGDVQRARDTLRYYQTKLRTWGFTIALQRNVDGLLQLVLAEYVYTPEYIEVSFVMDPYVPRR